MSDQPNDHSNDLHGPDAGPLPGEPGNPNQKTPVEELNEAIESGDDQAFDLSKFMPGLKVLPTVSSSSSKNVYTCVANKNGSLVGVSVTLGPEKLGEITAMALTTRMLEVPMVSVASQFNNPGETRKYRLDDQFCTVYMLLKKTMPICDVRVSPWEMRSHLEAGIKDQLAAWVWAVLEASGCAIDCKDEEELKQVLFSRLDQLPESPTLFWKDLNGESPSSL